MVDIGPVVDIPRFTDDFVKEWNGRKLNVNGAHVNFDGRYGIQCMDLWNYFWTELGIPVGGFPRHVDAAAVWEDSDGKHYQYFDGILPSKPALPGDVFIYNRKAWGTGYGHIGIVIKDNGNGTITVLEANGLGDGYEDDYMNQYGSAPRIHTWPKTNLYGYLRYINRKKPPVATAPVDKEKEQAREVWAYKNTKIEKGDTFAILREARDLAKKNAETLARIELAISKLPK